MYNRDSIAMRALWYQCHRYNLYSVMDRCVVWCLYVLALVASLQGVCGTKCYKDEGLGDREGNVYYCDGSKNECCEENSEFTCCEPASKQTLRDQAILWGGLAAVLLIIALVCCFFFKDYMCCRDNIPLSQKCCSCCKKKPDEEDLVPEPEVKRPRIPKPTWASTSRSFSPDDMRTPPPFSYKTPSYKKY